VYDLKLAMVNHSLVKAIQMIAACKRMVGPKSEAFPDLVDIDREVRAGASECQRVLALIDEDGKRPVLNG